MAKTAAGIAVFTGPMSDAVASYFLKILGPAVEFTQQDSTTVRRIAPQ
jgi:hypothetical protein